MMRSGFPVLAWFVLLFVGYQTHPLLAAITAEQQAKLADLNADMQMAASLYLDRKLVECSSKLSEVEDELRKLLQDQDPGLRRLAKPIYLQLSKAHELLDAQGIQLRSLPAWPEFMRVTADTANVGADPPARELPSELVSFATQIAPILLENCNGCHIGGRRASGNLRMSSYNQLLRGGDSGDVILARNPTDSLLIRKVKGEAGQRMPAGGRPPLSDEDIGLLTNWIQQGAAFDGPSGDTDLESVAQQAWATGASHGELFDQRRRQALEKWARVLPDDTPEWVNNDELLILGNVPADRLSDVLKRFEQATQQVKKQFKLPFDVPLIKGGLSVFVFRSRYDYSEFGRMTEKRELPKEWLGHWYADGVSAYAVMQGSELEEKQASALALQLAAGAYLGTFKDVPIWFAEGVARNLVAAAYRRADDRVGAWQRALPAARLKVPNARSLLENRLDEETAGLVGMGMTAFLMDRKNRQRYDNLLELLRSGRSFNEALTFAFASPEEIVKSWLGQ